MPTPDDNSLIAKNQAIPCRLTPSPFPSPPIPTTATSITRQRHLRHRSLLRRPARLDNNYAYYWLICHKFFQTSPPTGVRPFKPPYILCNQRPSIILTNSVEMGTALPQWQFHWFPVGPREEEMVPPARSSSTSPNHLKYFPGTRRIWRVLGRTIS